MPQLEKHFADPRQALRAPEVFTTRLNAPFKRWDYFFFGENNHGSPRRGPVVWEGLLLGGGEGGGHVKLKRAILWRTMIRASLGPQAQLADNGNKLGKNLPGGRVPGLS